MTRDPYEGVLCRRHRWWRGPLPRNFIGNFLGYGSCGCGATWWRNSSNPGFRRGDAVSEVVPNLNGTVDIHPMSTRGGHVCDQCFWKYHAAIVALNTAYLASQGRRPDQEATLCGKIIFDGAGNVVRRDGVLAFGPFELRELPR